MSDLIDFDSPNLNNVVSLQSPLIPPPDNTKNGEINSDEAGSHFFEFSKRRSSENNPFDSMMKKITEYEINSEDPFEKVISKAMSTSSRESIESKDGFISNNMETKLVKKFEMSKSLNDIKIHTEASQREDIYNLDYKENDMSIITDLNNTNLINDIGSHKTFVLLPSCDNKIIPNINVCPPPYTDLSILNNSVMNDSLLDQQNIVTKDIKLDTEVNIHARSMTEINIISPKKMVQKKIRRAMSICESSKNSTYGEDMISIVHSNVSEDPLNNAFRKFSSTSNTSSESSYLSNQFDLNICKQKIERLNSDSSVFSGLSNISAITADSLSKVRNERFYSESSVSSGISNLSNIPANRTTLSSCNSATFSNDTVNKGFIASSLHLNSTSSNITENSCVNAINKSDLIKKFVDIKTRMSISQIDSQVTTNKHELNEEENSSLSKINISIHSKSQNNIDKLVDIDNSSVFIDTGVDHIISHEARVLAETFEKMSSTKETNLTGEDELLFSLTQLNFDELPPSDDEEVENLIELAPSSLTSISNIEETKEKNISAINVTPKDNIMALEHEFSQIELKDVNKKADAAALLLNLKNIIEEEHNPDASKVLQNLQNLLGIKCDNNTEILKTCLQNTNNSYKNQDKSPNELQSNQNTSEINACNSNVLNDSNEKVRDNCRNNSFESQEIVKAHQNNLPECSSSVKSESPKNIRTDEKTKESENTKESLECKVDLDESAEDQKLALNFLRTLNKILNKKTVDTTDVLKSLGTVLNMATGLRVNGKDQQISKLKEDENKKARQLNNSTSTLYKSPSRKSSFVKSQNKSFEILPLRRSTSINPICNNNIMDKRKSHLINIKKRFPSDPGFANPITEIKNNKKCVSQVEQQCNLEINKTAVAPIKKKLKKTQSTESITKKGPLKAIIPLGNMQKRVSISQKITDYNGDLTPPKSENAFPAINIPSSTPNTSRIINSSKSKPKASSTPNADDLKFQNTKIQIQQISKKALSSSPRGKITNSNGSFRRMEKTLSPQKRPFVVKKNYENSTESRLPKYSPRPKKTAKSPLKIPRFGASKNIQMDAEKENHV